MNQWWPFFTSSCSLTGPQWSAVLIITIKLSSLWTTAKILLNFLYSYSCTQIKHLVPCSLIYTLVLMVWLDGIKYSSPPLAPTAWTRQHLPTIADNFWDLYFGGIWYRADSRFAPSQWETALLCNYVSHWLGTSLESALWYYFLLVWHHVAFINKLVKKKWPFPYNFI